ncbi:type IV secretion protein Rhs, partial [Pseudomonas sp. CCM 7891]|nr:type IV secretion protein Rhs [Pseudomonas karstica]
MNTETVDVEVVLRDFRHCLNTFDEWAESFWSFSALDVEQVFKVGDEVALVAPINRSILPSSTVAMCPASGSLTLVHMFQSVRFVPIGNTPVMLQKVDPKGGPLGDPIHKTIGPSGILEVTECTRGQPYRVSFYPNVSKAQVKALYASYQSVIEALEARLRDEWTHTFEAQWKHYAQTTSLDRRKLLDAAFVRGIANTLYNLWDSIPKLYEWLADLKPNSEKLLQYLSQAELEELLKLGSDAIANGLLILSDDPLLFIHVSAMFSWMQLLPPPDMRELLGEITAEVLINLLLIRAMGAMGVVVRLGPQVLGSVRSRRARQWLELMAKQLEGPRLEPHAERVKPLLLSSPATPIKVVPSVPLKAGVHEVPNPVPLVRANKRPRTTLVRHEHVDDVPVA